LQKTQRKYPSSISFDVKMAAFALLPILLRCLPSKEHFKERYKKINLGRLEKPVVIAKKPFPLEIL